MMLRAARRTGAVGVVTACLVAYSLVAAPIPALNEPHYLGKARHYWQPEWCAGDFFLESADAHTVFFATVGWLTTVCSLPMTAVVGRLLALTTLAWGWTALADSLHAEPAETARPTTPDRPSRLWSVLWSVWLFLALATVGNWSGEWLVGGVESKVFAYGGLFWAWSQLPTGRWQVVLPVLGAAVAFHPVVGLWGCLATLGAWLLGVCIPRLVAAPSDPGNDGGAWQSSLAFVGGSVAAVLVALPGLIPVLKIVLEPVDAATRYAGTYIQVYYRLGHHLDPMLFPGRAYLGYAVLAGLWITGWRFGPRGPLWSWLHRVTAVALVCALAGLAVGWGPRPPQRMPGFEWRMHLLKFYPFRLADALLPLMCTQQAARLVTEWLGDAKRNAAGLLLLAAGILFAAHLSTRDQRYTRAQHPDWQDACRWINTQAPPDAKVIPPHGQWTFKWYGERAEFVNFKDCPQDVRGIVEWNRRQLLLTRWYQQNYADGRYSKEELRALRRQTGADFLIADEAGPFDLPPVYQNPTYRVYDLRMAEE
jgi:hypothetical protein